MRRLPLVWLTAVGVLAFGGPASGDGGEPTAAERTAAARRAFPEPSAALGFSVEFDVWSGPARVGTAKYEAAPEVYEGKPGWKVTDRFRYGDGPYATRVQVEAHLDRELRLRTLERRFVTPPLAEKVSRFERGTTGWRLSTWAPGATESDPNAISTTAGFLLLLRLVPPELGEGEIPWVDQERPRRLSCRWSREPFPVPCGDVWNVESAEVGTRDPIQVVALSVEGRRPVALVTSGGWGKTFALERGKFGVIDVVKGSVQPHAPARTPREAALAFAIGVLSADGALASSVVDWPTVFARAKAAGTPDDEAAFKARTIANLARFARELLPGEIETLITDLVEESPRVVQSGPLASSRPYPPPTTTAVKFGRTAAEFDVEVGEVGRDWGVVKLPPSAASGSRPASEAWTDASRPEPVVDGRRLWFWGRCLRAAADRRGEALRVLGAAGADGAVVLVRELGLARSDDVDLAAQVSDALVRIGAAARPAIEAAIVTASPDRRPALEAILARLPPAK